MDFRKEMEQLLKNEGLTIKRSDYKKVETNEGITITHDNLEPKLHVDAKGKKEKFRTDEIDKLRRFVDRNHGL